MVSSKSNDFDDCSIGEYLDGEGYSDSFRNNYLIVSDHFSDFLILLQYKNLFGYSQ